MALDRKALEAEIAGLEQQAKQFENMWNQAQGAVNFARFLLQKFDEEEEAQVAEREEHTNGTVPDEVLAKAT